MNYYERHIGDYLKDTAHLSLLEHGIYGRLLDIYYTREQAIPEAHVMRLIGARSDDERSAARDVLNEFFTRDGEVWRHSRCDRELEKYADKQRKASASANARWKKIDEHTERNADAMRTHSEGNAPSNQTPVTSSQEKIRTARKRAAPAVLVSVDEMVAEGVDRQHATDWLLNRKTKGLAPLTPTIWTETKREAEKAGIGVPDAIRSAAQEGWGGFKAKWLQAEGRNGAPAENKFAGAL